MERLQLAEGAMMIVKSDIRDIRFGARLDLQFCQVNQYEIYFNLRQEKKV